MMSIPLARYTTKLPTPSSRGRYLCGGGVSLLCVIFIYALLSRAFISHPKLPFVLANTSYQAASEELCPQVSPLYPRENRDISQRLEAAYGSKGFRSRVVDWLGGAVRVETETYDQMGEVGIDSRWDKFAIFHQYLSQAFPRVHETSQLTKVNTYGLLYVWEGSNKSLKPILLNAHQDVVPVPNKTYDEWQHPPYSGYYDGESLWGRGSIDDKSGLVGLMSTMEMLLEHSFSPSRTVMFAFGFDEEIGGYNVGARHIGQFLLDTYGPNSLSMLVDEGGGFAHQHGTTLATIGIAEKGSFNARIEVKTPGGHSSTPPAHTSIGILGSLLGELEAHPFQPILTRTTPIYLKFQCLAAHAPSLNSSLRSHIISSAQSNESLKIIEELMSEDVTTKTLFSTTQAIDIVRGGEKTNALPESAWAIVNHRVSTDSSIAETELHDTQALQSSISHFNLSYVAFDKRITTELDEPTYGSLILSRPEGHGREPAPVSPTGDAPFRVLSGSVKAAYAMHRGLDAGANGLVVSPGMKSGNTDTKYYWKLTKHIFRYAHWNAGEATNLKMPGVHTKNERIRVDDFIEIIRYYTTLILNVDEDRDMM